MLTQYGEGSGATVGFVGSDSDAGDAPLGSPELYRAFEGLLAMKPLPDVASFSFGENFDLNRASAQAAVEATLAKLAAMGVTSIVSSGDAGMFGPINGDCSDPVGESSPAGSHWVSQPRCLRVSW